MLMLRPAILGFLWVFLAFSASANAGVSYDVQSEVALEASLETRLQGILRKALGTEDVIVIVNLDVAPEPDAKSPDILPGVPVKQNPSTPALGLPAALVRKVNVTLFLDNGLSEEEVKLAQDTASKILGLMPQRGDQVMVEKLALHRGLKPEVPRLLSPGLVLSSLWLILAVFALVFFYSTFYKGFLKPWLKVAADAASARAAESVKEELPAAPEPEKAWVQPAANGAAAHANGDSKSHLPFSFIEERHLPTLIYLLKKADPRTVAVIVHYMSPRLASLILLELSPELRSEVVSALTQMTQLEEGQVSSVEAWMKARLDFVMGGEEKLASILNEAGGVLRSELLGMLRSRDAALGDRLSERIVVLEDLASLSQAEVRLLSQRIPIRSLAAVLKQSKALLDNVLPKLSQGLAQWLTQEIELASVLPPDQLEVEQRRVLTTLQQLVREGQIRLKKGSRAAGKG